MDFSKIVNAALGAVYRHRSALAKGLAWPIGGLVVVGLVDSVNESVPIYLVLRGLELALQTLVAIVTHRVVLLGPDSVSTWGLTRWSRRETSFVLHGIGVGLLTFVMILLCAVPGILVHAPPFLGGALAMVLYACVSARLFLVFPAIAVGHKISYEESWSLTRNHKLLMCLVIAILPMLLVIPIVALMLVPHMQLLTSLYASVILVLEIAVLSMTYKFICGDPAAEDASGTLEG